MKTYILVGLLISNIAFAEGLTKPVCKDGQDLSKQDLVISLKRRKGVHLAKPGEYFAKVFAVFCEDQKTKKPEGKAYIYQDFPYKEVPKFSTSTVVQELEYKNGELVSQEWKKTPKLMLEIQSGMTGYEGEDKEMP